jgi:acyl-CoA thioesterase I
MDRLTAALILMTLLMLAGCTRSEPKKEARAPEVPESFTPAPTDTRPTIVAFGDSLSEGYGAAPGKSYPDFLQQDLDQAGYRYRVVNLGISGDTTTGGLGRVESVTALKPEIVILELGGNDGLRGVPVSATRSNLEQIIQRLRAAGVSKIVLAGMSLPPNYGDAYIRDFEKSYRDLAAQYKLTLIPFLFEDIRTRIAKNPGLIQQDGIHPTAEGNRIVAGTVMRYLKPVLKRAS